MICKVTDLFPPKVLNIPTVQAFEKLLKVTRPLYDAKLIRGKKLNVTYVRRKKDGYYD